MKRSSATRSAVAVAVTLLVLTACGGSDAGDTAATGSVAPSTAAITLVTYGSFPTADTSLNAALQSFTARTGIGVTIVQAGDAGTMVSKAVLTAGNPEGDVMWGVDNTLLSRAVDGGIFEPYTSPELSAIDPGLTALVPGGEVTPVDFGDVCINFDIAWFADRGIEPPATLDDLIDPTYADLLVVENPASSSPGLAFLLATIAQYGPDGWQDYWAALRDNGVQVVDSWDSAYYEQFSGSSGKGPRPLVVSYASSPPAEVIYADPPRTDAPTASMDASCFRQVEFAGVLRGTDHEAEARLLVDFLAGAEFQQEVALNLFVWPARTDVTLPPEFTTYASVVADPLTVAPADIAANREAWVDAWTDTVLR
ncbi:MAG: thiamine ABC transporter substrate-binding protein [Ilumatobacteraceae bacterium]